MSLYKDLAYPDINEERRKHKQKRLVPFPDSFFLLLKCEDCEERVAAFSHSQTVIQCQKCATVLAQPTGGRVKISPKCHIKFQKY